MDSFFNNHRLSNMNLPYAIYEVIGENFKLYETSQHLINLLGLKDSKELTNLTTGKFIHETDQATFQKALKEVIETKQCVKIKVRLYNSLNENYQFFRIDISINEWTENKKQLMLHFIIIEKGLCLENKKFSSHLEELKTLHKLQETVLNELPILVKIIDFENYKIRFLNKTALKYFNREGLDFKDKTCYKFIFNYDKPCSICSIKNRLITKEQKLYCPNKKAVLNILSYEIDWYGKPAIMQFAFDFSELKEKTEHINELQAVQKARNTFSAKMSHDLRTPLNAIINFAQFGFTETKCSLDKNYFNEIITASNYMLDLLNNLLEFDKIELKELVIHKKIANSLTTLKSIYTVLSPKAKEKKLKFTTNIDSIGPDIYVMIDVLKKKQVIANILSNAIKYTPECGNIDWTVKMETDSNGDIYEYHTICDDGIGMSKKFQSKMFLPFIRENNNTLAAEESSGLGLSIVKSIVDAFGGEISCESKIGEGTTFFLKLPIELATDEAIEKHKERERKKSKYLIKRCENNLELLVCEDNKVNQKIIKMILEKNGFKVTLASNGQDGLDLAKKNEYALIIMDIRMPILNGLDATKAIRAFDQKTPIIALSANAFESDIKKSKEAGMDVHLSKPINRRDLLLTISELIKDI